MWGVHMFGILIKAAHKSDAQKMQDHSQKRLGTLLSPPFLKPLNLEMLLRLLNTRYDFYLQRANALI